MADEPKPDPLTCARCGKVCDWIPDPGDPDPWELDGEHWFDPALGLDENGHGQGFTCSHLCYMIRHPDYPDWLDEQRERARQKLANTVIAGR